MMILTVFYIFKALVDFGGSSCTDLIVLCFSALFLLMVVYIMPLLEPDPRNIGFYLNRVYVLTLTVVFLQIVLYLVGYYLPSIWSFCTCFFFTMQDITHLHCDVSADVLHSVGYYSPSLWCFCRCFIFSGLLLTFTVMFLQMFYIQWVITHLHCGVSADGFIFC